MQYFAIFEGLQTLLNGSIEQSACTLNARIWWPNHDSLFSSCLLTLRLINDVIGWEGDRAGVEANGNHVRPTLKLYRYLGKGKRYLIFYCRSYIQTFVQICMSYLVCISKNVTPSYSSLPAFRFFPPNFNFFRCYWPRIVARKPVKVNVSTDEGRADTVRHGSMPQILVQKCKQTRIRPTVSNIRIKNYSFHWKIKPNYNLYWVFAY